MIKGDVAPAVVKLVKVVLQSLSCVWLSMTPWTAAPGFPVLYHLPELAQTHVLRVHDAIQPSHLLLPLLILPSIFPTIRVVSDESAVHIRWPKYWSFSFSISSSTEYSNLMKDFCWDWLVWSPCSPRDSGEFSPIPQFKASIIRFSSFFLVQISHLYITTGKTIALTIRTFVIKVTSLLFNMLSRFVIAFLPKNKHLLISWLQSPSSVFWSPRK